MLNNDYGRYIWRKWLVLLVLLVRNFFTRDVFNVTAERIRMKLRGYVEEDFTNYKKPSMFLITPYCDFKCCIENGNNICQNMDVIKAPIIDVDNDELIKRYLNNPITKSIVFGGLEPMDSFEEVREFINTLR